MENKKEIIEKYRKALYKLECQIDAKRVGDLAVIPAKELNIIRVVSHLPYENSLEGNCAYCGKKITGSTWETLDNFPFFEGVSLFCDNRICKDNYIVDNKLTLCVRCGQYHHYTLVEQNFCIDCVRTNFSYYVKVKCIDCNEWFNNMLFERYRRFGIRCKICRTHHQRRGIKWTKEEILKNLRLRYGCSLKGKKE